MQSFRPRTLFVVIILCAATSNCLAQIDSCRQFNSTAEQAQCANLALQSAEHDMKLAFDAALRNYTEEHVDTNEKQALPKTEQEEQVRWEAAMLRRVKASQRAWLTYRESACGTVKAMYAGGTIAAVIVPLCKADLTLQRTKFLRDYFPEDK